MEAYGWLAAILLYAVGGWLHQVTTTNVFDLEGDDDDTLEVTIEPPFWHHALWFLVFPYYYIKDNLNSDE
jgi:hypothetical protein